MNSREAYENFKSSEPEVKAAAAEVGIELGAPLTIDELSINLEGLQWQEDYVDPPLCCVCKKPVLDCPIILWRKNGLESLLFHDKCAESRFLKKLSLPQPKTINL